MVTSLDKASFGERLRALMLARGLNQTTLARKSGVERTVISRIMTGKAKPRPEQIVWMAKAVGIDANELLLEADLPQELRYLISRFRAAIDRIAELERDRDQAWAEVERLRSELRTRSRSKRANHMATPSACTP